jgi:hypothetical protein
MAFAACSLTPPSPEQHQAQQPDDDQHSSPQHKPDFPSIPRLFRSSRNIPRPIQSVRTNIRNLLLDVRLQIIDLLRRSRVRQPSIRLEIHSPTPLLQLVGRHLTPRVPDNRIRIAVSHENWCSLVRRVRRDHRLQLVLQQQVARQAEDAAQLGRAGDAGHQAHSTTLRETSQNDALGRNAGIDLALDKGVEDFLRAQHAGFVVGAGRQVAHVGNVVPAGHAHAHVDGDWDARGIGEDELGFGEFVLGAPLFGEGGPERRMSEHISCRRCGLCAYHPAPLLWS